MKLRRAQRAEHGEQSTPRRAQVEERMAKGAVPRSQHDERSTNSDVVCLRRFVVSGTVAVLSHHTVRENGAGLVAGCFESRFIGRNMDILAALSSPVNYSEMGGTRYPPLFMGSTPIFRIF